MKRFNNFLSPYHFKIEDLRTVTSLLRKDSYLCRLDLKDAYLLVSIHRDFRKFLRFRHNKRLFEFKALPFGLSTSPFIFTKIMKPVVAYLRKIGVIVVIYLDDFLIIGATREECLNSLRLTIDLLQFLGFIINFEKSVLVPSKICKFLGVIINSVDMTLELPREKKAKIKDLVEIALREKVIKIQGLEELIGTLVSACPSVAYGWAHYKSLEYLKLISLAKHNFNEGATVALTDESIQDLVFWRRSILNASNKIRNSKFDLEIFSDASTTGWGAVCEGKKANGFWNIKEQEMHINYLEIKAAFLALKCFTKKLFNKQILLRIDNITALAYINKMGGTRANDLHLITKDLWQFCEDRDIWVFAEYVASKENVADEGSRLTNLDTEWELASFAFNKIVEKFGRPNIDLFATRINKKCRIFCSWQRDPEAYAINAFTINWSNYFWYAFPPFAILSKVFNKISEEQSSGIILVPFWPSQPWYPIFEQLLISDKLIFKPSKNLLISPFRTDHPLAFQLTLIAGVVSGKPCRGKDSVKTL